jgi:hypothetical protein
MPYLCSCDISYNACRAMNQDKEKGTENADPLVGKMVNKHSTEKHRALLLFVLPSSFHT